MVKLSDMEYQQRLDREKELVEDVVDLREKLLESREELKAVKEELRRRHCYPLMGQTTAEAVRMAFDNGDKHIDLAKRRAAEAESDLTAAYAASREVEILLERAREATEVPAAEYVPALVDMY